MLNIDFAKLNTKYVLEHKASSQYYLGSKVNFYFRVVDYEGQNYFLLDIGYD